MSIEDARLRRMSRDRVASVSVELASYRENIGEKEIIPVSHHAHGISVGNTDVANRSVPGPQGVCIEGTHSIPA